MVASTNFMVDHKIYGVEKPYAIDLVSLTLPELLATNIHVQRQTIDLHDVRHDLDKPNIESHSFRYFRHASEHTHLKTEEAMAQPYAEEINQIVKEHFQAKHVYCIDLRVRRQHSGDLSKNAEKQVASQQAVHGRQLG